MDNETMIRELAAFVDTVRANIDRLRTDNAFKLNVLDDAGRLLNKVRARPAAPEVSP